MNLAAHHGWSVGELKERMTADEFLAWMQMREEEPWGPYRIDALAVKVLSYLVIGPHTSDPERTIKEIRLPWVKKKKREVPQYTQDQWLQILQAWGGKVREVKRDGSK